MEIPEINFRIKQLVDYYANSVVNKFAKDVGVAQQSLNRLFNIDTRTKKYPMATTEMLVAIIRFYKDVNTLWLMLGEGEMLMSASQKSSHKIESIYKSAPRDIELIAANRDIIETQKKLISSLESRIAELEKLSYPTKPTRNTTGLRSVPVADSSYLNQSGVKPK